MANGRERFRLAAEELEAVYRREVERLAVDLGPRIRAGEFSGLDDDGPKHQRLREELEAHPWLRDDRGRRLAFACSEWRVTQEEALGELLGWDEDAANAMAHDVLAEAARRGWVAAMRRVSDGDLYAVRRPARAQGRARQVGRAAVAA